MVGDGWDGWVVWGGWSKVLVFDNQINPNDLTSTTTETERGEVGLWYSLEGSCGDD